MTHEEAIQQAKHEIEALPHGFVGSITLRFSPEGYEQAEVTEIRRKRKKPPSLVDKRPVFSVKM